MSQNNGVSITYKIFTACYYGYEIVLQNQNVFSVLVFWIRTFACIITFTSIYIKNLRQRLSQNIVEYIQKYISTKTVTKFYLPFNNNFS